MNFTSDDNQNKITSSNFHNQATRRWENATRINIRGENCENYEILFNWILIIYADASGWLELQVTTRSFQKNAENFTLIYFPVCNWELFPRFSFKTKFENYHEIILQNWLKTAAKNINAKLHFNFLSFRNHRKQFFCFFSSLQAKNNGSEFMMKRWKKFLASLIIEQKQTLVVQIM